MIYITTAPTTYPCSTYYSNYSVFTIYLATETKTPYDLHRYSNYYISTSSYLMIYIIPATISSLRTILSQPLL